LFAYLITKYLKRVPHDAFYRKKKREIILPTKRVQGTAFYNFSNSPESHTENVASSGQQKEQKIVSREGNFFFLFFLSSDLERLFLPPVLYLLPSQTIKFEREKIRNFLPFPTTSDMIRHENRTTRSTFSISFKKIILIYLN
jgi:hypothetical protein